MARRRTLGLTAGNRCHDPLASPVGKAVRQIDTGYLIAQCPPIVIPKPRLTKTETTPHAAREPGLA
jgi:hypothetical protein